MALISVSDKEGVADFAKGLAEAGYTILSTGGTLAHLQEKNIPVTSISVYTGSPEILGGRVKTLHPKIYGGILARRDIPQDIEQLEGLDIDLIDVVVVNLYPFIKTVANPNVSLEDAIENIDIGGPTMLRATAKNYKYTTVVTDPTDYSEVLDEVRGQGNTSLELRERLAVKVFSHTANYDSAIDQYLSKTITEKPSLRLHYTDGHVLRYGENSHQSAQFFKEPTGAYPEEESLGTARQLHGKELSYNNLVDADAALEVCKELWDKPAVSIIKHMNPCGLATGETLAEAFEAAWEGDPVSAFGSVIVCSRKVDLATAESLKGRFVEILLAPGFEEDALEFLKSKSKDIRLLEINPHQEMQERKVYKHLLGGMLVQDRDVLSHESWDCVTETTFSDSQKDLALFTWKACKHVKSNAIVAGYEYKPNQFMLIGMGPGQPNRIDSNVKLCQPRITDNAERMAKEQNKDPQTFTKEVFSQVVLASDAFFPFDDNVKAAKEAGVRYIVQPGGSKRDPEVIATANDCGIAMIFTGTRHFRH
jgi:phosphoribosylaminoimidazolecarboxamide formyltransferase/IMP cyclohydrolase